MNKRVFLLIDKLLERVQILERRIRTIEENFNQESTTNDSFLSTLENKLNSESTLGVACEIIDYNNQSYTPYVQKSKSI